MAAGEGFNNVASGIGGVFSTMFGENGMADEIAAIRQPRTQLGTATGGNYSGGQGLPKNNTMLYVIGGIVALIVLFMLMRK